jgi:PilZ domain-containing protein
MRERRKTQRLPAYLGGQVAFFRRRATADCIIRNTSATGAKLVIQNCSFVPDEFELTIPQRQAEYRVRARWRGVNEIGVELEPLQTSDAPVPLALVRRMKRLEAENADLKRRMAESE